MTQLTDRVQIGEQIVFHSVGNEIVLLNLADDSFYGLNPVARRAWELLADDGSLQAAYEQLLREFKVNPETLAADLLELVNDMLRSGLLQVIH